MARGHAEALMPMVAEVMQESGTAFASLDLIAATVGPGSFTGVRIAIAAARGLALVTHAGLFGTDSLSVMARSALASGAVGAAPFAVAVDARRGMLYLGLYDEAARKIEGPLLIAPDEAARLAAAGPSRRGGKRRGAACRSRRAAGTQRRRDAAGASAERGSAGRNRRRERRDLAGAQTSLSAPAGCKAAGASGLEALMPVEIAVTRASSLDDASHGGHAPKLLRQGLGRDGDDAIPRRPRSAVSDRLRWPTAPAACWAVFSSRGRRLTKRRCSRSCVAPACRNAGLGRALLRCGHGGIARGRHQAIVPRSRGRQRRRARALSLARRGAGRPDARNITSNGADAAIFSLALSTGPEDDGTALARRPA